MAFSFRGINSPLVGSGASPRTINNPGLEGDLVVVQVSSSGSDVTPTAPGWLAEIVAARNTTVNTVRVYWGIAPASPDATITVTFPSGSGHTIDAVAFDMADGNVAEVDDADTQSNGAGDRIHPSIDTSQANDLGFWCSALGNIGSTPPASHTELWDNGSSPRTHAFWQIITGTGATGTRTATGTAAANQASSVAFKEVASADLTPPSDLAATPVSTTAIDLDWSNTASGHDGWKIERSPAGAGTWSHFATTAAGVTSFGDTALTPDTAYDYRVRAYAGAVDGSYSNTATASTYPTLTAPYNFTATADGPDTVNLAWDSDDDPADFDGFGIERSLTGEDGWSLIITVDPDVYAYADTGLAEGTTYYYRVRGVIN